MINETLTKTYSLRGSVTGKPGLPDNEKDAGGWEIYPVIEQEADFDTDRDGLPDWWENHFGSDINSATGDFSDANEYYYISSGYTALEYYLNWMAMPRYVIGENLNVDLSAYSVGYPSGVTYKVKSVNSYPQGISLDSEVNASVSGSVMNIRNNNYSGLATAVFEVSDAESGSEWEFEIGLDFNEIGMSADKTVSRRNIRAYSNSAKEIIVEGENMKGASVKVYNTTGMQVCSSVAENDYNVIDMSGFSRGCFIIIVEAGNEIIRFKVM